MQERTKTHRRIKVITQRAELGIDMLARGHVDACDRILGTSSVPWPRKIAILDRGFGRLSRRLRRNHVAVIQRARRLSKQKEATS